jgi:Ca2+-binding EF-hand superfamily protein
MIEEEPNNLEKKPEQKKEKRKYNLKSSGFRQRIEQNLDKNSRIIKKLKKEILTQGSDILFNILKTLIKFDVENNGKIDLDEFSRLCYEYNINLTPDEIKTIFGCFDPSRTGKIFYEDLYNIIHDPLNDSRMVLVDNLYNNLNKNNRGNLEIKTFLSSLAENNNDNLDEFKDKFLLHHDFYTKGKTEVNYDEFIDFFEILSTDYKEDIDFENYIKNSFNIITNDGEQKENEKEEITDKNKQTKEFLEYLDTIRNILIKQGPNGVIELLRNLRNVDQSKSNGIDIDEFVSVIDNLFKDNENKFSMDEIQTIFNVYDIQESGVMEYQKFISDLLKLKSMSKYRKNHLETIFNHLDFEGKRALDINYLTSLYKEPKENNPFPDLIESFINFHNIIRGNRNPLVTKNNFIDFYNYINFLIPETKNDELFKNFTSESWLLYDKSFDERKNLAILKVEALGKQKNREAMNKLIRSNKTPYGTMKDKINYNLNEKNATMKYNVNKIDDILVHLRSIMIQRGYIGIMSMRRTFMLVDENSTKEISFDEFEKIFKAYRYDLSETEINNLFNYFDKEGNGYIKYEEFLNELCNNLNQFRKDILKQVFNKLDEKEKGFITVGIIRHEYNPKGNPLVRQGKRSEDEILAEFLDVLEYHFNLLIEKNEDIDVNELEVDFEEFCNFYKNISLCIEDDKYFEIMVLSEWGIQKEGKSLYQKTWNKSDA